VRFLVILAWTIAALALGCDRTLANDRVALVIGNGAYMGAQPLPNPKNDATDVAEALRKLGFQTIVGFDLDKAGMDRIVAEFANAAITAEVALVYYSGHGIEVDGTNYMVPIDLKFRNDRFDLESLSSVSKVVDVLKRVRGIRVIVLDACRDNPLESGVKRSIANRSRSVRSRSIGRGLARLDVAGTIVSFATAAGMTADDGAGRNSPYTEAFLDHIGAQVSIEQVFTNIMLEVNKKTNKKQSPMLSMSLTERYYLRGKPNTVDSFQRQDAERLDEEAWQNALRQNTASAYRDYATRFPNGGHVAEARRKEEERNRQEQSPAPAPPPPVEFVHYQGVDFNGDDLDPYSPFLPGHTVETCASACRASAGCRGFTFNTRKDVCILKSGYGRQIADPTAISAATSADPTRPPPPDPDFLYQNGVDFSGDDLDPSNPFLSGHTLDSCETACRSRPGCRAFTFNTSKNVCILKSGTGRPRNNGVAISGINWSGARIDLKHGVDYAGGDLYDVRFITRDHCKSLCEGTNKCVAFSYVESKSWCWLKKELTAPRNRADVVSGTKYY
jgi:hypothetical protein